jgi:hypothetical protein
MPPGAGDAAQVAESKSEPIQDAGLTVSALARDSPPLPSYRASDTLGTGARLAKRFWEIG